MADSTTTGSAMAGTIPGGLIRGFGQRGVNNESLQMTDKVLFVFGPPTDNVTVSVGSQLCYDVQNNDVYCGLVAGGSEWNRLEVEGA